MSQWKTTKIRRETLLRLRSVKVRFDFKSLDEVFTVFLAIRDKMAWDKVDMYAMAKFGKVPVIVSVEGRNEEECLGKLGLGGPKTGKVGEIGNVEEIGKASTGLFKDKKEEKP